MPCCLLLLF